MRKCHHLTIVSGLLLLPIQSFAVPVTYDFQAVGDYVDAGGTTPLLPAGWLTATSWDIRGSIVVDSDIPAEYDDPYIWLSQSIIGGSLSINGTPMGDFDSGRFKYFFMDGFEESARPYDVNFSLSFDETEEVGPARLWFYSESLDGEIGPDVRNIDLSSLDAFLNSVNQGDYMEFGVTVGGVGSYWTLDMMLVSDFVPRDGAVTPPSVAAPEPASLGLIALGLAGIGWRRSRRSRLGQ